MSGGKSKLRIMSVVLMALVLVLAGSASAQSSAEKSFDRFRVGANLGFGASSSFGLLELGFDGAFYFNENLSIGPWLELGLAENAVQLLVTANTRYEFEPFDGKMKDTRAFGQVGLGLAYDNFNADATDFLINYGLGIDHPINDTWWIGTNLMFNTIPSGPPSTAFVFTWQFFQVSARF
jgi:hypothetical protein